MDQDLLVSLSLQMTKFQHPFFLSPFKVNEPLLDKNLLPWLQKVNENIPLARLRLFSNGSPLTAEKIIDIAALANVEHFWISLNSVDETEYESVMSLRFEQTAAKLDLLHRAVENKLFPHKVVVSRVSTQPWSAVDRAPFNLYCAERWPYFIPFHIKRDGWLGFVPPADGTIPKTPCARWWELSVLSTGMVSLCCMDGNGEFPLGDLNKDSMLTVYNRGSWFDRRYFMATRLDYHPCSTCTY
jgi:hypothetical protein